MVSLNFDSFSPQARLTADLGGPGERHAPEVRRSGARVSRSRKFKLTHYPKNWREKSVISIVTEDHCAGIVKLLEKLAPASK